jgi:hypothetical protein
MIPEVDPQSISGDPFIDDIIKLEVMFVYLLTYLGTYQVVLLKVRVLQALYL